ncbi:hypothetical protein F0562_019451 [Nyssa sinensis]|uniref:DUF4283 domain-containing protein n=1 Tax=Nyssa sinensis TaxID=561372 RepID=A0A5J5BNG4_9ASTE|nr:hypothetical protein F0562_019451 [Nyssa sinensis]
MEFLQRCLVGRLADLNDAIPERAVVQRWVDRRWEVTAGVKVFNMHDAHFLFELPSKAEVMRVLQTNWWFHGKPLQLDRKVSKTLGECCGGFLQLDKATAKRQLFRWARVLVKTPTTEIPSMVHNRFGPLYGSTEMAQMNHKGKAIVHEANPLSPLPKSGPIRGPNGSAEVRLFRLGEKGEGLRSGRWRERIAEVGESSVGLGEEHQRFFNLEDELIEGMMQTKIMQRVVEKGVKTTDLLVEKRISFWDQAWMSSSSSEQSEPKSS